MPHTPLRQLLPDKFPRLGDEEFGFDSENEDTDNENDGEENSVDSDEEREHLNNEIFLTLKI